MMRLLLILLLFVSSFASADDFLKPQLRKRGDASSEKMVIGTLLIQKDLTPLLKGISVSGILFVKGKPTVWDGSSQIPSKGCIVFIQMGQSLGTGTAYPLVGSPKNYAYSQGFLHSDKNLLSLKYLEESAQEVQRILCVNSKSINEDYIQEQFGSWIRISGL